MKAMEISKTRKEKSVIIFFMLTLAVIVIMAIANPQPPGEHDEHNSSASGASIQERITQVKERLSSDPNNVNDLITLGDLYLDNNQLKAALNEFSKAVRLEPQNAHALGDLGITYQRSGFYDKSFDAFKALEKIDPNDISALYYIGMLNKYYKKDNTEALRYFELLLSKNPDPQLVDNVTKEMNSMKAGAEQ